jgi:acetylornithine/succinyldiaminopimelate/putrescine aminotransferase
VYHNEWAGKLAELLITLTQQEGGLGYTPSNNGPHASKVFFANSGTEANEGALKIARKVGKDRWAAAAPGRSWDSEACTKTRIVCFEQGFHGRSMGALSVTTNAKYQAPFAPLIPGVDVGKLNQFDGLETLVTDATCAVIVEPIQGEGGIHQAKEEWLRALRKRCDDVGAVLIFDEIQVCSKHPLLVPETKLDLVRVVPFGDTLGAFASPGGLPSGCSNDGETACQWLPHWRSVTARHYCCDDDGRYRPFVTFITLHS